MDMFSTLKIMYDKKWAMKRIASVMVVGFGVGMVYYGMPLNLGGLGSNLYISVAINALAELPSSLLTFFLIGKINRRSSLVVLTAVSGVMSMLCVFMEKYMVVVEVLSFFCACTAFNVLLIYSVELFPTCVRNSAVGMVRQALVFGGVFAPLLVAAGRGKIGKVFSFGVFGVVIGFCGVFVSKLPETKGGGISNTIEEEESKETASSYVA